MCDGGRDGNYAKCLWDDKCTFDVHAGKMSRDDQKVLQKRSNNELVDGFQLVQVNRRTLAKFDQMCPGVQTAINVADTCPALKGVVSGNGGAWSSMGYQSNQAILVKFSSGAVSTANRSYVSTYYALCE